MRIVNLCVLFCVLTCGFVSAAPIFTNGFEPGPGGSFSTVASGPLGPWTVGAGGVDWIGSYWAAASGSGSLDLAGDTPGSIATILPTVIGQKYVVTFALAGNPDARGLKKVGVTVGDFAGSFDFDTTNSSTGSMGWVTKTLTFTASGGDQLLFSAQSASAWGPALDNISVSAVPEPATFGFMGLGLAALGLLARRRNSSL